jgi:beta-galactosidase
MQKISLNRNWRFHTDDSTFRWGRPEVSKWQIVDLPHDWSVHHDRSPDNPSIAFGGYFKMGRGWYQKNFNAPEEWRTKRVFIEFEGVYMNAEVWLNGHLLGRHPYGYTPFQFDLSPYLKFGQGENELFVSVDNSHQLNSRWYSGSGIYRPVWLFIENPVHIALWGVSVTTPQVSYDSAVVRAQTMVSNESDSDQTVTVRSRILAEDGTVVDSDEVSGPVNTLAQRNFTQDLGVDSPSLWSPDNPYLYHLETHVLVDGQIVDIEDTPFGIRTIEFSPETGFLLNGVPLLMKGGCVHHDNGILGAASYARSEERKVEIHKASGYNAIRCAHNPPSVAFLDACDRLGMLVIDEAFDCWREGKTTGDYHSVFEDWWQRDLETMVYRDRNHPSVVVWSIGNELVERMKPEGAAIASRLADHVRALDPSRPVTAAINGVWAETGSWSEADATFAALDVCGYNYQREEYAADREKHPQRIIFGTESFPIEAFENWMDVLEIPNVIGDFVWTSLDYLGESGIGRVHFDGEQAAFLGDYPWHQANCGDLDLCGFKRPQSFYRSILWENGDKLYIAVHNPIPEGKTPTISRWGWPEVWSNWNWEGREGEIFKVDIYSAYEQVELFLNGKSLGVKAATRNERFIATFEVPYEPGELKAVGFAGGQPVGEMTLKTIEAPSAIHLKPDRPALKSEYGDLCFVTVEIVDSQGNVHPAAENEVFFSVQGPAIIAAVGNANPESTERYVGNHRKAHHGRCLVVVKTMGESGTIRLRAHADGLNPAEAILTAL